MNPLKMVLWPATSQTQVLLMQGPCEILRAVLPPPIHSHKDAAPLFLEALSRWFQQPVSVALVADGLGCAHELNLCDVTNNGRNPYYTVEVVEPSVEAMRAVYGLGDLAHIRLMAMGVRP